MDYATEVFDKDGSSTSGSDASPPKLKTKLGASKSKPVKDKHATEEEYKQPAKGAVLDYSEVPEDIRKQIDNMGVGKDVKIQFVDGTYKVSYMSKKATKEGKHDKKKDKDVGDDEPTGYVKKSVHTKTCTSKGKTTKKVTTTYTFADGSTKVKTRTTTY